MMMIRVLVLLVGIAVASSGRPPRCEYQDGQYSPFYWKGYENVCTKSICDQRPELQCYVPKEKIMDVVKFHMDDDIDREIQMLNKYFSTQIGPYKNKLGYGCTGMCNSNAKQLRLERIFTDVNVFDEMTYQYNVEKHMCIVIGPDIYYQECGGKCKTPYAYSMDNYCVPDVTVSMDIWVYCPAIPFKKCHKVRFDVPVSCTCKKIKCKRGVTIPSPGPINPGGPIIPGLPVGGGIPLPGK